VVSSVLEGSERLGGGGVDSEHHSLLAVTNLAAVEPEGSRSAGHVEAPLGKLGCVSSNGEEARVQELGGVRGEVRAWVGERGLGDGVVLGSEGEGDGVTNQNVVEDVGGVSDALASSNDDVVGGLSRGGGDNGQGSSDGRETHV